MGELCPKMRILHTADRSVKTERKRNLYAGGEKIAYF